MHANVKESRCIIVQMSQYAHRELANCKQVAGRKPLHRAPDPGTFAARSKFVVTRDTMLILQSNTAEPLTTSHRFAKYWRASESFAFVADMKTMKRLPD